MKLAAWRWDNRRGCATLPAFLLSVGRIKPTNMRTFLSFCVLLLLASCSKESGTGSSGELLESISVNGKIDERFFYNNDGQLRKFERFLHCTTSPMDEEEYHYGAGKLVKN